MKYYFTQFIIIICFIHIAFKTYSQVGNNSKIFSDTILIVPDMHSKVLLVRAETENEYGLEILSKYKRLDTLKMFLINDIEEARKNSSYSFNAKTTHYFVSMDGKGTLRPVGEDNEKLGVNVKKEEESLKMNLPLYEYIIHDMSSNFEYCIYVDDPARLIDLAKVNLNDVLILVLHNDNVKDWYYRVEYKKIDGKWILSDHEGNKPVGKMLVMICVGGALIGSELSPSIGFDYGWEYKDKYGRSLLGIALGFTGYTFTEVQNNELTSFYPIYSCDLKLLANFSNTRKPFWVCAQGGFFQSHISGWLDRAIKFGAWGISPGKVAIGLDLILYRYNNHLNPDHGSLGISAFVPIVY